jgi:hypothetical protein
MFGFGSSATVYAYQRRPDLLPGNVTRFRDGLDWQYVQSMFVDLSFSLQGVLMFVHHNGAPSCHHFRLLGTQWMWSAVQPLA